MERKEIITELEDIKAQLLEIQAKLDELNSKLEGGWEATELGATKRVKNKNTDEITVYTIPRSEKKGYFKSYFSHVNTYAIRYNDEVRRGYRMNKEKLERAHELYLKKQALIRKLRPVKKSN